MLWILGVSVAELLITTLSPSISTQIESIKSLLNEFANSCKEVGNKYSWIEALLSSDLEIGASGIWVEGPQLHTSASSDNLANEIYSNDQDNIS
ncbi:uncharacterized protein OCT59_002286 [Rhizophagus irregularis]|uniref:uncharacterized protein n=1 Tax=Rhizophagus irregularis TaxID=588596 RepID=UPI00332EB353|nr:hypothetical protein OCT59_002286 [Rhizophagus irregularis]